MLFVHIGMAHQTMKVFTIWLFSVGNLQNLNTKQDYTEAQGEMFFEFSHADSPLTCRGGPRIDRFAFSASSTTLSPVEKIKSAAFTERNKG